jgi:D-3-phosphoglycerate dehydrogenase
VDIGTEWDADEMLARIKDYHGLIIRSATKVTADVIQAGENLQVVGRAGVGVDNVDVKEATKRGVIVVNAPQSNVLSAAEQTIALLMASARNLAQAHADLKNGEWNKGKWGKGGVEVRGKTLGIIGLGRIGFLVAEDARGLGMNVLASTRSSRPRSSTSSGSSAPTARTRSTARPTSSPSTCPRTPRPSGSSATTSSPR